MVQYHKRSKSKNSGSGGMKRNLRDKIKAHVGGFFAATKLDKEGKEKREGVKAKGSTHKTALIRASFANVSVAGKTQKTKILNVVESTADRHHSRENIITKGSIIETEHGRARVTSRPGQHGIVNAVLVEKIAEKTKKA